MVNPLKAVSPDSKIITSLKPVVKSTVVIPIAKPIIKTVVKNAIKPTIVKSNVQTKKPIIIEKPKAVLPVIKDVKPKPATKPNNEY